MKIVINRHTENEQVICLDMKGGLDIYYDETTDHELHPPECELQQVVPLGEIALLVRTKRPALIMPHSASVFTVRQS